MSKTARQIRSIMNALDMALVTSHFDRGVENAEDEFDDIPPFIVCDGVSVDAFNTYVRDGEGLPIAVRCLDVDSQGGLLIVELPTRIHESTASKFDYCFLMSTGDGLAVAPGGATTVSQPGR